MCVPAGCSRENSRCLSSPQKELWPKNSKKGGKGVNGRKGGWGQGGWRVGEGELGEGEGVWVPGGSPRKNLRSLSSRQLELWLKNSKNGGRGKIGRCVRGVELRGGGGDFFFFFWREVYGLRGMVHAKTLGLNEAPNWSYGQNTKNMTYSHTHKPAFYK